MTASAAVRFSWTTAESQALIRQSVVGAIPQWTDGPRSSQIECWAYSLARTPTLLIASTGWGKTSAFYGPVLIIKHLLENPAARPRGLKIPTKPVVLVVTPLIELGYDQVREIHDLGLTALAITADTLSETSRSHRNLYKEVQACSYSVVFVGPERLVSKEFSDVLRSEEFLSNLFLLGVDETHLVDDWGKDFRLAYRQIGLLRHWLPSHVGLVAVTATLAPGRKMDTVKAQLGMKDGYYHLIRLSCERSNVRLIFRELKSGLGGYIFPEIAWAFKSGKKVVIYCATIDLTFRVALYGWDLYASGTEGISRLDYVRVWNSITSRPYNERTLDLFKNNPLCRVIVATIAFGLGMNVRVITDAVNLGLPNTLESLIQQNGRAGRDPSFKARGWTYVERSVISALQKDPSTANPKSSIKTSSAAAQRKMDDLDPNLKAAVTAHINGLCLVASTNKSLGNDEAQDAKDALVGCIAAARPLPCSSCAQDYPTLFLSSLNMADIVPPAPRNPRAPRPELPPPLSVAYREIAARWLDDFAHQRWVIKTHAELRLLPPSSLWNGISVVEVLDHFHLLRTTNSVPLYLPQWEYVDGDGLALSKLTIRLNRKFDRAMLKAKQDKAQKAEQTKKAKAEEVETIASTKSPVTFIVSRSDKENRGPPLLRIRIPASKPKPISFPTVVAVP